MAGSGYDRTPVSDDAEVVWDANLDLFVREGTTDSQIVREMPAYAPIGVLPGETVLDLGANIGGYAREAIVNQKAGKVVCFEPDPYNFAMLQRNTERFAGKVALMQCAILGSGRGEPAAGNTTGMRTISFYKNVRKCKASHSTVPYRGREVVTVNGYDFDQVVAMVKPARIKADIEGEEHYIFRTCNLPDYVKGVLMELHLQKDDWRSVGLDAINNNMLRQGFVNHPDRMPRDTGANWHTLVCWRRDL